MTPIGPVLRILKRQLDLNAAEAAYLNKLREAKRHMKEMKAKVRDAHRQNDLTGTSHQSFVKEQRESAPNISGLVAVTGPAAAGKTRFMNKFGLAAQVPVIAACEPQWDSVGSWNVLHALIDLALLRKGVTETTLNRLSPIDAAAINTPYGSSYFTYLDEVIGQAHEEQKQAQVDGSSATSTVTNTDVNRTAKKAALTWTLLKTLEQAALYADDAIINALNTMQDYDIWLIDSIKDVLYSGGSLGRGGISMSSGPVLSSLSARLERAGVLLLGSVNPVSDAPEVVQLTYSFLKSNCTGVMALGNSTASNDDETNVSEASFRVWKAEAKYYERVSHNGVFSTSQLLKLFLDSSVMRLGEVSDVDVAVDDTVLFYNDERTDPFLLQISRSPNPSTSLEDDYNF